MIRFDDNFNKRKVVLDGVVADKWFEMIEKTKHKQLEQKKLMLIKYRFNR